MDMSDLPKEDSSSSELMGKLAAGPTVVAYIREQGVDDIEVMVASHADSDHIGVVYARPVCRRFISRKQV